MYRLRWGTQVDTRTIIDTADREADRAARVVHPEQVAAYLAKYLTKTTEDFGLPTRVRSVGHARRAGASPHAVRIIETARTTGPRRRRLPTAGRDLATLGYRGHPITKSRCYSVTFGQIRRARRALPEPTAALDPDADIREILDDDDRPEGFEVVSSWVFVGQGYLDLDQAEPRSPPPRWLGRAERRRPQPILNHRRDGDHGTKCRAGSSSCGRSSRPPTIWRCRPRRSTGGGAASTARRATGLGTRSATGLRKCGRGSTRTRWRPEAASWDARHLPIGSWGLIRTYPVGQDAKGKPIGFRRRAYYRDFDGVTRRVEASGRTATMATTGPTQRLQNRTLAVDHGDLTAMSRFSRRGELWLFEGRCDGRGRTALARQRSTPTVGSSGTTCCRRSGEVRLGEATTPLVDKVIGAIKADVSAATARSCRSVISGVMGLAVRYGAIPANPVREVERIEARPNELRGR